MATNKKPKRDLKSEVLQIRMTREQRQVLEAAAEKEHLELSTWIRATCLKVATGELPATSAS